MATGQRTHEERERHLAQMEESLLDGRSVREVVMAAVSMFGISQVTAYEDVKIIKARWAEQTAQDKPSEFSKAVARRERMVGKALKVANRAGQEDGTVLSALNTAAGLERDKSRLLGLYPEKKVTVGFERPKTAADLSDEELMAIIAGARGEPTAVPDEAHVITDSGSVGPPGTPPVCPCG